MAVTIATYNVKDLFDSTGESDKAHVNRKLDTLAAVVSKVDADVLALQEVGSESVLDRLRERLPGMYGFRMVGTADARGIRCALLSRLPVRSYHVHATEQLDFPRFHEMDPSPFGARIPLRRGIVHAEIDAGALGVVHALVLHFKSARPVPFRRADGVAVEPVTARAEAEGELRTLVWRASEALFVRGLVDDLLTKKPGHHLLVTGDFNDVPGSTALRIVSGAEPNALLSAADALEGERFSVLHRGARAEIDHMLLSSTLRARVTRARYFNEGLRDHSVLPVHEFPTPDSDHAPLVVRFE
ncbi:endonuclease/exonuclease/phosphatase family protein [Pendulispora rubella]|uniref:Endonuclease/exonuclease/phosphatase family protein n=1 Tax=Pendulispora rubella TaxID=2741070 RepID=A0ABZ2L8S5_9BACT